MVMHSFKRVSLSKEVSEKKAKEFKTEIQKLFGDEVKVRIEDKKIVIFGEGLTDYRIHDKIIHILREE